MKNLVELINISKNFYLKIPNSFKKKTNKAVEKVNLNITQGEVLGLVGESGSGKTTLGNIILNLHKPTSGQIMYKGKVVDDKNATKDSLGVVFQDPFSSLNPKLSVFDIIKEPIIETNKILKTDELITIIVEVLKKVGLSEEHMFRFPHEFSGGQRQRIAIARAIVTNPDFIVLDEPTSGLDVSVQAQILNLLIELKKMYKSTYLFISHNLGVIKYMSDRIAVMLKGRIIEVAETKDLFNNPIHPYTKKLLSAVPNLDDNKKLSYMDNSIDEIQHSSNTDCCVYFSECQYRDEICKQNEPQMCMINNNHIVYCHKSDTFKES